MRIPTSILWLSIFLYDVVYLSKLSKRFSLDVGASILLYILVVM